MNLKNSSFLWKTFPALERKLNGLTNHTLPENAEFMGVYLDLIARGSPGLSLREMYNIYQQVSRTRGLGGEMAEVGVFRGESAKLIARFKGDVPLHLFDTFAGMPETDSARDNIHQRGDFRETSLQLVQGRLRNHGQIYFHPGYFPQTALEAGLSDRTFCFVHLDMDIYRSTLDGLNFFYPRLIPGGAIISHDYFAKTCAGVKKAFDEFCRETGVVAVPLWDSQCLIIKPGGNISSSPAEISAAAAGRDL
jgi:O-methyltransferase